MPKLPEGDSILLKIDGECRLLPVKQIDLIEATDKGTLVHWNGYSGHIGRTIGYLEEQLDPRMFIRTSRDSLINLRSILSLRTEEKVNLTAQIPGNRSVTFSRRHKSLFLKTHKI